jgi:hypothetical protein
MRVEAFFLKKSVPHMHNAQITSCAGKLVPALITSCVLVSLVYGQDRTVTGRVTDSNGNPIEGVLVATFQQLQGGGYRANRQETTPDGTYHSYGDDRVIFFRKLGFQPITKVQSAGQSVIDVTLERENPGWTLKQCSLEQQLTGKHYGLTILLSVPTRTSVRAAMPDADNQRVWILFPRNKKERLLIWSGPLLGGGIAYFPEESLFLQASLIKERLDATSGAMDVRGKTANGQNWRSLSFGSDIAEYEGVSEEAAGFFDQILDSACLRNNEANK